MCGIYGQVDQFTPEQLLFLAQQLHHRGPDEYHWKEYENYSFFHTRLSIVDAAGGAQPMETARYAIVFNGEIYNHQELRHRFALNGKTRSDTETLLLLYEKLGEDMLPHLDGMFAFVIYDKISGELFLARDRVGEKPLYYMTDGKQFSFASELNTLSGIHNLTIRSESTVQFLVCGWIGPGYTIYEQVFHVLPGHYIKVNILEKGRRSITTCPWWSLDNRSIRTWTPVDQQELVNELFEHLKTSIKRRIESSDLPVGCFLSGGIDSGLVATLASFIKAPLPTYTFVFEDEYNEGPRAAKLTKSIRTNHQEIAVNYDQLQDDIGTILLSYGEPFCDDSAIPSFYIAREAKKLSTVIINGDGGDELFGGYRRYVPLSWPNPIKQIIRGVSKSTLPLLPVPKKKISQYNYLYRLAELSRYEYPDKYLAATTDLFYEPSFFQPGYLDKVSAAKHWIYDQFNPPLNTHPPVDKQAPFRQWADRLPISELHQFMRTDILSLLPVVLLKKVDISTMQSSLESRTVFFTPEILALAARLSTRHLIKGSRTKVLLRELAKNLLPAGMSRLPKRGFEAPLEKLVTSSLSSIIKEYLLHRQRKGIVHDLIPLKTIEDLVLNTGAISSHRRSKLIYSLFTLEYWWVNR